MVGKGRRKRRFEDAGAAYFFVRSGNDWLFQQRVLGNYIAPGNQLGRSVSLKGCTAVIGAPYSGSDDAGKAHVYECN